MKIRFGVVGIKGFGSFHIKAVVNNPAAELYALCDIDEDAVKKEAAEHGCKYYTDYNEMFADGDIDAVILATPDQIHREMAVAALNAKKHVLCEKPLALHIDDCAAMLEAGRKNGKFRKERRRIIVFRIELFTDFFIKLSFWRMAMPR